MNRLRYNSVAPTVENGGWTDLQADVNGNLKVISSISAITPGVAATSLGKAEDAAHASGDVGVAVWGVANEANVTFAADGDYTPIGVRRNGTVMVEQGPFVTSRKTADGQVKAGAGFIHTVTISGLTATPTAGLVTIYDALTETGTVLYSEWVFATVVGHTLTLDIPFATGCFVGFDATLANAAVVVSYR